MLSPYLFEINQSKFSLLFCASRDTISFIELQQTDYSTDFSIEKNLSKFKNKFNIFFDFIQNLKDKSGVDIFIQTYNAAIKKDYSSNYNIINNFFFTKKKYLMKYMKINYMPED